ncbi:GBS Bsp-like repeat-containing protein [Lactococcus insecticola]|uniref:N-acetylmuramoyl-L-alanine amidase domain-containing protein n=1 Tax=Pseudolactococcus insecticola TaxID=2709158 RepID=A0A6A0B4Z5_9LACT|nr:GBS Bsp-like repeat-containing protein [Lactococcus insecticola]GFH40459.1 hypothetical protein Hs20B_08570 [Lactococcus insecticola]
MKSINKKIITVIIFQFALILTVMTAHASVVNQAIISQKIQPVQEKMQLGGIYSQNSAKNGGINMSYAAGKPQLVIIHDVGVDGGSIQNSISYMIRTQENAFVHAFVDGSQLITIADTAKKAWGAGIYGNRYGIQIEQMRVGSRDAFYKQIATLANWTSIQLLKYNMGAPKLMTSPNTVSPNPSSPLDGNIATHKMISYKWGGTDHTDPDEYWARFGYDANQFTELVTYYYNINKINYTPEIKSTAIEGNPATGTFKVRVKTNAATTTVKVPVWSNQNGQDDIVWYDAKKVGTGEFLATVSLALHGYESGNYSIAAYAYAGNNTAGVTISNDYAISLQALPNGQNRMYRIYNQNSGEHFYTASLPELRSLVVTNGWHYEGIGWLAPEKSTVPVYRVYNKNAGDHHYTTNVNEKNSLVKAGWKYEGIGWYSDDKKTVPVYRAYNKNAKAGSHNYTVNLAEQQNLIKLGWRNEGIGWYALGTGN